MWSQVRMVKATIGIVVVLSVQLGKMPASQMYRFGTSCVCAHLLVTYAFGSFPKRHAPVSCKLVPGRLGSPSAPHNSPPIALNKSIITCFECSHISSSFWPH